MLVCGADRATSGLFACAGGGESDRKLQKVTHGQNHRRLVKDHRGYHFISIMGIASRSAICLTECLIDIGDFEQKEFWSQWHIKGCQNNHFFLWFQSIAVWQLKSKPIRRAFSHAGAWSSVLALLCSHRLGSKKKKYTYEAPNGGC